MLSQLTSVDFLKTFGVQEPVENVFNVRLHWMADTRVDSFLSYISKGHVRALKDVDHFSHVTIGEGHESLLAILSHCDALFFDDVLKAGQNLFGGERAKSKSGATRLQCWNDLAEVVADDAETDVVGILFDN